MRETYDPFYIFDIITENRIPEIKKDAIDHLNGISEYEMENKLFYFKQNGSIESLYFYLRLDASGSDIEIGFLDDENYHSLLKDNKFLHKKYSEFHNDRYRRIAMSITLENFIKMESQYIRDDKISSILSLDK